jgi:hypothetical protein
LFNNIEKNYSSRGAFTFLLFIVNIPLVYLSYNKKTLSLGFSSFLGPPIVSPQGELSEEQYRRDNTPVVPGVPP